MILVVQAPQLLQPLTKYLNEDGITPTDYFWNETLMGKLIPFKVVGYYDLKTEFII